MTPLPVRLTRIIALLLALGPVHFAFADGKLFRLAQVADEPGITAQRAVIAFRNGIETLIVQSDVDAQGSSLGWVLPLPAPPTSIEPCPPNTLTALSGLAGPAVLDEPYRFLPIVLPLFALVALACADHLRHLRHPRTRTSPLRILLAILASLWLLVVLLPTLGRGRGLPPGLEVLQTARAGVYDVSVIQGPAGDAVANWLTSNGFVCPPPAAAILNEYAARKWCFLAARVAPEAAGQARHHPLQVAFPVAQPVYPLRLTGAGGDPIQLDLYVIADQRAAARSLETWLSDTYGSRNVHHSFTRFTSAAPPVYQGSVSFSRIGIPAISAIMWPGCVLTRLHGRLRTADMSADLTLQWVAPETLRATVHTYWDALGGSAALAIVACSVGLAWSVRIATRKDQPLRYVARRGIPGALALALAVGLLRYGSFTVVHVEQARPRAALSAIMSHQDALSRLAGRPPTVPFPEAYRQLLRDRQAEPAPRETDQLDEPGDFHIDAAGDGWLLTILDEYYTPISIPISPQGIPPETTSD